MVRLRFLLLGLATLALVGARPALAGPINFTGFVANDFNPSDPNVRVTPVFDNYTQVGQKDWMTKAGLVSGWAIKDVRSSYDQASDTLYVGFNTFQNAKGVYAIVGDADGSGNPGVALPETLKAGGVKYANLGGHDSVAIGIAGNNPIDPNAPGTLEVVAGVPAIKTQPGNGFPPFTVAKPSGDALGFNFGQTLTSNLGTLAFNPSAAHPGFEFTIKNFSKIAGIDPFKGFWIEAYAGQPDDVVVGEAGLKFTRVPAFAEQNVPEPSTLLAWALVAGGAAVSLRRRAAAAV